MERLKKIKKQILEIKEEIKPLEEKVDSLKCEIDCLIDEARSQSKFRLNDLVKLKKGGQIGFVKDIIAEYITPYFMEESDAVVISYRIGAVDKKNKPLGLKMISNGYFPECLIELI